MLKAVEPSQAQTFSRKQVREFDQFAIKKLGIAGVVLMENAGRGVSDVFEHLAENRYAGIKKVAILAGKGNNAGDGFVIARHLMMRGYEVTTCLLAPAQKISGDAKINLDVLRNIGADIVDLSKSGTEKLKEAFSGYDFLIDALGGTGISGALTGSLERAVLAVNSLQVPVLSVDIPTGVDCDSFDPTALAICAVATVSFVGAKPAFSQPQCDLKTGELYIADIGISPGLAVEI